MTRRDRFSTLAATAIAFGALTAGIAFAAVGDLDTTFDGDGIVKTNLTGNSTGNDVVVQADGKIVAAGSADTAANSDKAALLRYNADGSPDNAGFGLGDGQTIEDLGGTDSRIDAVALRSTGQIVVAGNRLSSGTFSLGQVKQYTSAGVPDPGFNSGNPVGANFGVLEGQDNDLNDVAISPANGDVIAVGRSEGSDGKQNFALLGLTSAGVRKNPFAGSGTSGEAAFNIASATANPSGNDTARSIAFIPGGGGKFIVAGSVDSTVADGGTNDDQDVAVAQYTAGGSLDTTAFGGDGISVLNVGFEGSANDVAVLPDGKILIAGSATSSTGISTLDGFVARLNTAGTLNTGAGGFGDGVDGVITTGISNIDTESGLTVLPSGKIALLGERLATTNPYVERLTASGQPDTSFGGDGILEYDFDPDSSSFEAITSQPDGKLVAAGALASDVGLFRLQADPPPPVVQQQVISPPVQTPQPPAKKKCKKGQKLAKGKCVKKKRRKK